jgi:hypothetical protein
LSSCGLDKYGRSAIYSSRGCYLAWKFKNFVSERGENVIREWIKTLPKKVQFKIDGRIKYLQTVEELKYPYVEKWAGVPDLFEVRVTFSGVQYRMLGCYGPGRTFILLTGAVEKDWKLEPRSAEDTATTRMKQVGDEKYVSDHFEEDEEAD